MELEENIFERQGREKAISLMETVGLASGIRLAKVFGLVNELKMFITGDHVEECVLMFECSNEAKREEII